MFGLQSDVHTHTKFPALGLKRAEISVYYMTSLNYFRTTMGDSPIASPLALLSSHHDANALFWTERIHTDLRRLGLEDYLVNMTQLHADPKVLYSYLHRETSRLFYAMLYRIKDAAQTTPSALGRDIHAHQSPMDVSDPRETLHSLGNVRLVLQGIDPRFDRWVMLRIHVIQVEQSHVDDYTVAPDRFVRCHAWVDDAREATPEMDHYDDLVEWLNVALSSLDAFLSYQARHKLTDHAMLSFDRADWAEDLIADAQLAKSMGETVMAGLYYPGTAVDPHTPDLETLGMRYRNRAIPRWALRDEHAKIADTTANRLYDIVLFLVIDRIAKHSEKQLVLL